MYDKGDAYMIKGMDVSSYMEMKARGCRYYDWEGAEVDVLDFAVSQGFDYARLRLWNEPERIVESGGYCGLNHTKEMARELKKRGLPYLLDFHYSDWWADPEHQNIPAAWQNMSVMQMEQALYDFTKDTLLALKKEDIYPDMIQIGNEIRNGMLFPTAQVPNWENLARLVQAGLSAAREVSAGLPTELMLHLDEGATYRYYEEWFDKMMSLGTNDFDLIGLSYYPYIHGSFEDFEDTLHRLAERYSQELVIAEFAHPFRRSRGSYFGEAEEKLAGYPASGEGQEAALRRLQRVIEDVPDNKCRGFFYWEPFMRAPEGQPEDCWGTFMELMDEEGKPQQGFCAIQK